MLDPERAKKDGDVVELLLPLVEKHGSSSVLPSSFVSAVSSVTAPHDDSALLFFPMSVLSSTTQFIVKASTQSPTPTALTALSLINSNSLGSSASNNHNDDNDGNTSTPPGAPVTNPPVPPPLQEPPPAPSSFSLYFIRRYSDEGEWMCVCVLRTLLIRHQRRGGVRVL